MTKKIIKLINNERTNAHIMSRTASTCTGGAYDYCSTTAEDLAECTTYAYDKCGKDYSACSQGADDVCMVIDNDGGCQFAWQRDYCMTYDYTD